MGNPHSTFVVGDEEESHRQFIEELLSEMDISPEPIEHESNAHHHEGDFVAPDPPNTVPKLFTTKKVQHILNLYHKLEKLGVGASCSVRKMRERKTGDLYAVKTMRRSQRGNRKLFRNEVEMLSALDHPHIIKYHEHFMDEKRMCIATEYCSGHTLAHRVVQRLNDGGTFSEQEAAECIRSILSVAVHLHSKQIVHRDFKCNNVVFTEEGTAGVLKVIDFGRSLRVDPLYICYDFVGTLHYAAPESAYRRNGETLKKSDVWAIGVICFMLVTGRPPFNGSNQRETIEQIMSYRDSLCFPDDITISEQCKDFLHCLLCCDVDSRLSAEEALCHEWIMKGGATPLEEEEDDDDDDSVEYSSSMRFLPTDHTMGDLSATMSYTVNETPRVTPVLRPHDVSRSHRSALELGQTKVRSDFDFTILDDMDIDQFLDGFLEREFELEVERDGH